MTVLRLRKLADRSTGRRETRWDPETGERYLYDPDTPGFDPEPWPLAGIQFEGEPPTEVNVSTRWVASAIAEGWLEGVNPQPVVRPAGARQHVWNSTQTGRPHVFVHYDALVFKTVDGDVRYAVVHQPDKYVADGTDGDLVTPEVYAEGNTRVDWFYGLRRED